MYDKLCFDRVVVNLYTTISYNILYYMYDKLRVD